MPERYCVVSEDELKDIKAQIAGIQAWIRNDANIEEIQKRVNVLEYLLQKLERKLTQRAPDLGWVCGKCKTHNADGVSLCGFCDTPRLSG